MFSFKAYFFGHDVYINGRYKYSANEILTSYLDTDFYDKIMEYDLINELKKLNKSLIIDDDMDYEIYCRYNSNVYKAIGIFETIHNSLRFLPPYDKIIGEEYMKLDDLLNKYDIFFEDGIDDYNDIDWDTVTEFGTGEINELGNGVLRLHTFLPQDSDKVKEYDKEMTEWLFEFHRKLNSFFNGYISLLESYRTVFEIFKPFIDEYLHKKETYLSANELAKSFDEFNKTHAKNFQKIKCRMNSFGYKSLVNESGENILCEEISFDNLESFLYYDFFNGIRHNYIPNQCKHCGKYFLIQGGKYLSFCGRKLKDDKSKTCRDVGSRRRYGDKCKNDPIWQTYNRAYKAHYARYMKKKMTISEFEEWSRFASEIRDKAISENISFDDYYTRIRK